MKKIYDKPTMILVKMETEHFIAASPGKVDHILGYNCCLKNTYFFILFSKKIVIFAGKNIKI